MMPQAVERFVQSRRSCAILAASVLGAVTAPTHAQLRVVNFNIAQLNGTDSALIEVFSALKDDDRPGFAVAPHVYVFQEVRSQDFSALTALLDASVPPGVSYAAATYTNANEDDYSGAQALFYRTDLLTENAAEHRDLSTGAGRKADRWKLQLVGYDSPDAGFYVYSAHLKSSTGEANEALRLSGANALRADAESLPAGTHFIYAGDFNIYHNQEPAYQALLAAGNGQGHDPLGSGSWAGGGNAIKHSQSPRLSELNGLVGGGLDDRFDFQLPSSALIDGAGLTYIAGTYRSLGNDGLHYNISINDGSNFYFPDDLARSNALADALFEASDHLPVIAEYQIPAVLSGSLPADFDRVIQGASVQLELEIRNAAPVEFALGAEPLDFTAIGDGNLVGSCSGTLLPLDAPTVCSFDLFTASVGVASGSVVAFTGMQQGVQNEVLVLETTGTVLRPAAPSFDPERLQIAQAVMVSFDSNSGLQSIPVAIHNLGFDALQALLDVDAVTGLAAPLALAGPLPTDIGNDAALIELRFDTAGLSPGIYPTVLDIEVSDEDLPGEQTSSLVLDVTVEIVGAADCPADLNHDGTIDVLDLVQLIVAWGACPAPCAADVTGDGAVDVLDLVQVILGWGPCG